MTQQIFHELVAFQTAFIQSTVARFRFRYKYYKLQNTNLFEASLLADFHVYIRPVLVQKLDDLTKQFKDS